MNDLKNFEKHGSIPWASIIKVMIIFAVFIWMGERDRQHVIDKNALTEIVQTQSLILDAAQCGVFEMTSPIGRVES